MKAPAKRKLNTQVGTLEAIKSPYYYYVSSGGGTQVYDINGSTGAATWLGWLVNGTIVQNKVG